MLIMCWLCSTNNEYMNPHTKRDLDQSNYLFCLKYLPKLQYAGKRLKLDRSLDQTIVIRKLMESTTDNLLLLRKPCTLGLQQLTTCSSLPDGIELPNLTSLHLFRLNSNFQCESRLKNVTELSIYETSKNDCVQILKQIGQQVKILWVDVLDDTLEVDVILNLCPNLKHLSVGTIILTAGQVDPNTLRQLNVLEIRCLEVDQVLMQLLLQAPELMRLVLFAERFPEYQRDSMKIFDMLQQHKILQKMERVVIHYINTHQATYSNASTAFTMLLLEAMTLYCPYLIDVSNDLKSSDAAFEVCWET